jgi:hypothetical protein
MEEPLEESTDVSFGTTLDLAQAQAKLEESDASQGKGKTFALVISFLKFACWFCYFF